MIGHPAPKVSGELSDREQAVIAEIASGAPLKVIAANLSISIQAVSTYLRRAKHKLGVHSRAELLGTVPRASGHPFYSPWSTRLTPAELSIAEAIVRGDSNAAIAKARRTSLRTVENQVAALLSKVRAGSRTELMAACRQQLDDTGHRSAP